MVFKINIAEKSGKTFKLESDSEEIIGKKLHESIQGKDLSEDLEGYEFEITGTSDKSGFTSLKDVEGIGLKKELLSYEKGMKKNIRKEGKKKLSNKKPKGLRLRKTVRGNEISKEIVQINLKILKDGAKKLAEVFPEQNKAPEPEVKEEPAKEPVPEKKEEATKEEVKEEPKVEEKAEEKPAEPDKDEATPVDSNNQELSNKESEPSGEAISKEQ